jgi:tRNA nucleotidyltransferase (CCA-adding enzyme)
MRPAMLFKDKSSPSAIRRLARDCGRLDLLMQVFQADCSGRPPFPDNSNEAVSWIRKQMEKLTIGNTAPEPIIKGRHLLDRGWNSGPAMGRFLSRAYEAQLDGTFVNDEEAMQWLEEYSSQSGNHAGNEKS